MPQTTPGQDGPLLNPEGSLNREKPLPRIVSMQVASPLGPSFSSSACGDVSHHSCPQGSLHWGQLRDCGALGSMRPCWSSGVCNNRVHTDWLEK